MAGRPITNQGTEAKNVSLNVRYTDLKGQVIDPAKVRRALISWLK
jgi:hypothetical protein